MGEKQLDYNTISYGFFGTRLRNKRGMLSSETCGEEFHSNVDIKGRLSVGNWKLQVENISEQELRLWEWQNRSDFVFWWRHIERRAKDWKLEGSRIIKCVTLFIGERRVQNRDSSQFHVGFQESLTGVTPLGKELCIIPCTQMEMFCMYDHPLSWALSPNINVRFLNLDFKMIELYSQQK